MPERALVTGASPGTGAPVLLVTDRALELDFSFADLLRYHGPHSPGGVAHAFKVMERAFGLLVANGRPERRELRITTAFGGPGARDGFELVTRAVTEARFTLDPALARPELGPGEKFVFRFDYRERSVVLAVQPGFVSEAFVALAGQEERTPEEERRLDAMKLEMAERVMGRPAAAVYALAAA
jgi:hypothetical protein